MRQNEINSFLYFDNYIVDKVYFKNNPKYEGDETALEFSVIPNIIVNDDEENMIVELTVNIFDGAVKNNYPFEMSVTVVGFYSMHAQGEDIMKYKKNAIAILYPYVRAIVSSYTANANVNPLLLPTINVNKLIEVQNEKK
ncbi:MAG: protein-export chaperone SecB [Lachnospiraceae bacterium]|nr:protein-export chaperone SecB [Lachnospiraceae bacterium]